MTYFGKLFWLGLMIVDKVALMVVAVMSALALANLNAVDKVVGVTDQMKMIGQNHFHQVNAWSSEFMKGVDCYDNLLASIILHYNNLVSGNCFLEETLGLTLRSMMIYQ